MARAVPSQLRSTGWGPPSRASQGTTDCPLAAVRSASCSVQGWRREDTSPSRMLSNPFWAEYDIRALVLVMIAALVAQMIMRSRAVVLVTHRLTSVTIADRIVLLVKGRVIQHGTPDELLGQHDGLFRELWDRQNERTGRVPGSADSEENVPPNQPALF
ncbi:hypothetical protein ABT010_04595 [Streptomyces sp. NPDC002668]|uniref:hypothetical protein n=1 Tax=Streptomyces sp. NPDC002668 TaxID=3154422 RepID=UPI00331F11C3